MKEKQILKVIRQGMDGRGGRGCVAREVRLPKDQSARDEEREVPIDDGGDPSIVTLCEDDCWPMVVATVALMVVDGNEARTTRTIMFPIPGILRRPMVKLTSHALGIQSEVS